MRLVLTQGPLHAIVAGAVAAHAQRECPDENVLVIGGLFAAGEAGLAAAIRRCSSAGPWADVIDVAAGDDPVERLRGIDPSDVHEVVAIRNWQALNTRVIEAYPDARVTVYGDTFGIIDTDPAGPRVDRVLTVVPQPERADVLAGVPLEVVPRDTVVDAVRAVRESVPGLTDYDAEMADWAKGGVLALLANMADGGGSSLRGEITQGHALVRRLAEPGAPVLIKPHPRAALGQAAALARRLRADGHPVRVITNQPFGVYPVELFEATARAVAGIQSGQSTAVVSLRYLYGVEPHVDLPRPLLLRTEFPYLWRLSASIIEHNRRLRTVLPEWDGRSPLPVPPRVAPGLPERLLGVLPGQLLTWSAPGAPREARVAAPASGGGSFDPAVGIAWDVPEGVGEFLLDGTTDEPRARVLETLVRLRERAPGAQLTVAAYVRPSVNAPRWERLLSRDAPFTVADDAHLTAEEIEDLLEIHVDVTERRPELIDRSVRRAVRRDEAPLRVEFAGRVRD